MHTCWINATKLPISYACDSQYIDLLHWQCFKSQVRTKYEYFVAAKENNLCHSLHDVIVTLQASQVQWML